MTRTTSFFLIVLTLSTTTYAADGGQSEACPCDGTRQVIVAFGSPLGSLPGRRSQSTHGTRLEWRPTAPERKWVYVVIHHSATESGSVNSIHNEHLRRKDRMGNSWLGIGYHFVIGNGSGMEDGNVRATFRWKQQIHGAHSGSVVHNANGIGICLIGNFQNQPPTEKQLKAVTSLVGQLSKRYQIPRRLIIGHNTVKPTACPGKLFPLQDVIRDSVSEGKLNS